MQINIYHTASKHFFLLFSCIFLICSCSQENESYSIKIYKTTKKGDNLKLVSEEEQQNITKSKRIDLYVDPNIGYQTYIGFGASFTESSAWNLATLPIKKREQVLMALFHPEEGAGFTLTRTHINSCDYSNKHYTYVDDNDYELKSFSIYEDIKGFKGDENEQVSQSDLEDPSYDLIPMILEASKIKDADFKIIASPWSPPSWMKEGETDIMTNGTLAKEYYSIWAKYLSKYISAYKEKGISIWGITPQNEPLHAHDARWDSNGFTPEQGRDFLKYHLGPQLTKDGHLNPDDLNEGVKVLIYDHNKSTLIDYVKPTYDDPDASKYAWGTAFHWYASSELEENNFYIEDIDTHRKTWEDKGMIHTESSIDIDAEDPIGQYWRESTDYAGKFIPFDTYVYDIMNNLNHGTQGYIEWCMILSNEGKPNPYDNFNSAPVLINPTTDEVIYTPLYYLLSHFSKFIRPDAYRINIKGDKEKGLLYTAAQNTDKSIIVNIYNKNNSDYELNLTIGNKNHLVQLGPNTLQTIQMEKMQ